MKKNTLVAIILIIFDITVIWVAKIILRKKDYYRIVPHYYNSHEPCLKRCRDHPVLNKKYIRNINAKSSNDELIELIRQFFGGRRK